MRVSSSTWTFADSESCRWWGALWADRCELSDLGDQIVKHGLADRSELAAIVARLLGAVSVGAQRDPCRAVLILDALSVLGIVDRGLADGGERRRFSAGKF